MKSLYTNLFISSWTRLLHTQMYYNFKIWPRYDHFTKSSYLIVEKFPKSYPSHTHFITHTSIILPIFVNVLLHCTYLAVVDCCVVCKYWWYLYWLVLLCIPSIMSITSLPHPINRILQSDVATINKKTSTALDQEYRRRWLYDSVGIFIDW